MKALLWLLVFFSSLSNANEAMRYEVVFHWGAHMYIYIEHPYKEDVLKNIAVEACPTLGRSGQCLIHYWTDRSLIPKDNIERDKMHKSGNDLHKYAFTFAIGTHAPAHRFQVTLCTKENKENSDCKYI